MAITTETNRTDELTTDGVETDFDFALLIHDESWLQVKYKADAGGDYTDLVLDTDYGVVFTESGGTVSTEGYRVPLADGKLLIIRRPPLTEKTNWLYNDNHTEQTHQNDFDHRSMCDIWLLEQLDRCPKFPIHSDTVDITFPEPVANEIIGWNAGGTDLTNMSISAIAVLVSAEIIAGDVPENLDDLADVDAVQVNGNFIVADGTNWVSESGATARTSLGLGTGDSPRFARIGIGIAPSLETCRIYEEFDHITSGRWGITSRVLWNPVSEPAGVTTLHAGWFQAEWGETALNADAGTYYVYGVEGKARASVVSNTSLDYAIGLRGVAENQNWKTTVNAIGVQSVVENDATFTLVGNITSGYNFLAQCLADKTVGTLATRYGYYFEDATGGGNLTTQYAIYCPALAAAAGDNLFIKNISADSDFGSGDITMTGDFLTTGSGGFGSCVITQTSYTDGLKIIGFPPADDSYFEFYIGIDEHPYLNGYLSWYIQADATTLMRFISTGIDAYVDLNTHNNDIILGSGTILTTGTLGAGAITGTSFITGGDIGIAADTDLLQLADGALTVNGTISAGTITGTSLIAGQISGDIGLFGDTDLLHLEFSNLRVNGTLEIGSADGSDKIRIYHDNTNAYFRTDDGRFIFQTDEGTNTDTWIDVLPKGTGQAYLRVYGPSQTNSFVIAYVATNAELRASGTTHTSLSLQSTADIPIWMFSNATEGETPQLQLSGYRTGDTEKHTVHWGISPDANDTALFSNVGNCDFDTNVNVLTGNAYKFNSVQVVGAQGAAVADATDADDVILRLNDLLARVRTHGLIAA